MTQNNEYSEANIKNFDPLKHIRRRPGMYFGGTGIRALHHFIDEVLNYSLEGALEEKCDTVTIRLQADFQITISDNDQYIPTFISKNPTDDKTGRYTLDIHMIGYGISYPGMSSDRVNPYLVASGLHSVGTSAVNALTAKMSVTVSYEGEVWKRTYREGVPVGEMQHYRPKEAPPTGMTYTFQPDFTIMDKNEFEFDRLAERCWDAVYNVPNLTIHLIDERVEPHRQETLTAPEGLKNLVEKLNADKKPLHDVIHVVHRTQADVADYYKNKEMVIEFALQYTDSDETIERGYMNTIRLNQGGTHVDGLRSAMQARINHLFNCDLNWGQISKGLTLAIGIFHPEPYLESSLRMRLMNDDAFGAVAKCAYAALTHSLLLDVADHIDAIIGREPEED